MKRLGMLAAFVCVGLLGAAPAGTGDDKFADMIGKPAPEIAGTFALDGKPTTVANLKGKVVMLDFWAVWCGPCVATFPHVKEWNEKYKDKGLEIVGLTLYNCERGMNLTFDKSTGKLAKAKDKVTNSDEEALLKDFAEYHKLTHHIQCMSAADWKKVSGESYHVSGIPTVVLIDRKGMVRLVKVGSGKESAEAIAEMIGKLVEEKE